MIYQNNFLPPNKICVLNLLNDMTLNQNWKEGKDIFQPVMKDMIKSELLKHVHMDVKIFIASYISDLSRLTILKQPYYDGLMKVATGRMVKFLSI